MATVFKFPLVMTLNRKGLHRDEPGAARLVTETTIEDALKRARRWRQSGSTRTRGGPPQGWNRTPGSRSSSSLVMPA